MEYFTYERILLLHSMVIDETGGLHGVRDLHPLLAVVKSVRQKAFGQELYQGIFKKAAVYVRTIIQGHPFLDGNKRTAILVAGTFMEKNGYLVIADE